MTIHNPKGKTMKDFWTTFKIAIPRPNGYGFDYKQKTIHMDFPKDDCGFLDHEVLKQRIFDYIKNEMHIERFRLVWYTTPSEYWTRGKGKAND